jgi:hypothetical protein
LSLQICLVLVVRWEHSRCMIMPASFAPKPAPPSSSGSAMPSHPSFASAACNSCGSVSDWSCSRQYSFGKLAQIFEMASLTVNCSSVKPDISINLREGEVVKGRVRDECDCDAGSLSLYVLVGEKAFLRHRRRWGSWRTAIGVQPRSAAKSSEIALGQTLYMLRRRVRREVVSICPKVR